MMTTTQRDYLNELAAKIERLEEYLSDILPEYPFLTFSSKPARRAVGQTHKSVLFWKQKKSAKMFHVNNPSQDTPEDLQLADLVKSAIWDELYRLYDEEDKLVQRDENAKPRLIHPYKG